MQRALLTWVCELLPTGGKVLLVGESEFGRLLLVEFPKSRGWQYALVQSPEHPATLSAALILAAGLVWPIRQVEISVLCGCRFYGFLFGSAYSSAIISSYLPPTQALESSMATSNWYFLLK